MHTRKGSQQAFIFAQLLTSSNARVPGLACAAARPPRNYRRIEDAASGPLRPGAVGLVTEVDTSQLPYQVEDPVSGRTFWYVKYHGQKKKRLLVPAATRLLMLLPAHVAHVGSGAGLARACPFNVYFLFQVPPPRLGSQLQTQRPRAPRHIPPRAVVVLLQGAGPQWHLHRRRRRRRRHSAAVRRRQRW